MCNAPELKLPSVPVLASVTRESSLLAKFDLKSGFLHIPLRDEDKLLYCFQWLGEYFWFEVMPWGTTFATWVFHKLQEPLGNYLIELNIPAVNYIDDLAIVLNRLELSQYEITRMRNLLTYTVDLLTSLGFFYQKQKVRSPRRSKWFSWAQV